MSKVLKTVAVVVGAVAAVATGIGAIAGVAAIAGIGMGTFATIGAIAGLASTALNMMFPPKPSRSSTAGSQTSFRLNPADGIPYAIGRTAYAGNAVHRETWGKDNKYQGFAIVWSGGGPIQEFEQFQADRYPVTFSGDAATGKFGSFMWLKTQLGATPSPALASPVAGFPGWGADQKLSGYAASTWVVEWDEEGKKFPGGLPKPLAILKGVKVYDPRLDSTFPGGSGSCRPLEEDTYVYSENPWLHALTWALGRWQNAKKVLGVGMALATINVASFAEAANVADANGWKAGGVVSSVDDKWEVMKMLAQAGGGQCIRNGAQLTAFVEQPRVSLATITREDLVGKGRVAATQMSRRRINGVVPVFRSEAHGWEQIPADPVRFQTYVDEDGTRRTEETPFVLVQEAKQAAELAAYEVLNAREFGPIDLPLAIRWLGLEPGDQVDIDIPELGLNSQPCLALARGLDPTNGNVNVSFRSETTGKHATALGQTTSVPPSPSLQPRDLSAIDAPVVDQWDLQAVQGTGANGEAVPLLQIDGSCDNPIADAVVVRYRPVDDPVQPWAYHGEVVSSATRVTIHGVLPATAYEAEVAYRVYGVVGAFRTLDPVVTGALTAGGFVNGGDLAYEDAVAFNDGTILESAGGSIATLASFRTADGTAAAITGQGALATRSTVGLPQMLSGADYADIVVDRGFSDYSNSWVVAGGAFGSFSLVEGATATAPEQAALDAMGVDRCIKLTGDGNPHGGAGTGFMVARPLVQAVVTPGEAFRFRAKVFTEDDTSATPARVVLTWFRADGGLTYTVRTGSGLGLSEFDEIVVVPATVESVQISWQPVINSGSTANRDVVAYMSGLSLRRAARLGADVARENGTTRIVDADAITSLGTAAAFAGQGALATQNSLAYGGAFLTGFGGLAAREDVYFGSSFLRESNGGAVASLSAFRTADGTAAAVLGQGAFATESVLDFATMSSYFSNFDTSHIVDGAGLGLTADWAGVTGSARPEDYATSSGSGANLVRTPHATNGNGGWVVIGASVADAPSGAASGAKSFAIQDGARELPAYDVIPAGRYRLRFWAKTLGCTGSMFFVARSSSGSLLGGFTGSPTVAAGLDWTYFDVEVSGPDRYDACPAWDLSNGYSGTPLVFGLRFEEIIPTPWDLVTDDGNRPADNADVTNLNTAAAIAGQGIGATSNSLFDLDAAAERILSKASSGYSSFGQFANIDELRRAFVLANGALGGYAVGAGDVVSFANTHILTSTDNRAWRFPWAMAIGEDEIIELEVQLEPVGGSGAYRLGLYSWDDAGLNVNVNFQTAPPNLPGDVIANKKIRIGGPNVDSDLVDLKCGAGAAYVAPMLRINSASARQWKLYFMTVKRLSTDSVLREQNLSLVGRAEPGFVSAADARPFGKLVNTGSAAEGDAVSFGVTYQTVPKIGFGMGGKGPTAGREIQVRADGISASGFTMKAVEVALTPLTTHTDTVDAAGGAGEPDRVMHKSASVEPWNGQYKFVVDVTVPEPIPGEPGILEVDFFVRQGGVWVQAATATYTSSGNKTQILTPGAVPVTGEEEFGVSVGGSATAGATLDELVSVSYTEGTTTEYALTDNTTIPWIAHLES